MKTLLFLAITIIALSGCAYNGPRVDVTIGFMGTTFGVGLGGNSPQALPLPVKKGLDK